MFIENLSHLEKRERERELYGKACISNTLGTGHGLLQITLTSYKFYLSTGSTISMSKYSSNIEVTAKKKIYHLILLI